VARERADVTTATERLAAFTTGLAFEAIPPDVLETARLHLLDTLGCGLAAHALDVATAARTVAAEMGGTPEATVIGLRQSLPAAQAALANGMLCHGLDFDDTHGDAVCHVTVVVGPAALAVAEARGASGRELLAALVGGSEVVARVGMAAAGAFHRRGFHPTSVCGIFGATAAAARLDGLDAGAAARALGIAGSLASGLLAFLDDGAPTKPIHPGWAAHGAIMAARLAARGAAGPAAVLEARHGLYDAFVGESHPALERELADLGTRWETRRIAVKPYPACHYVHGALGATEQATGGQPIAPEEIVEVVVAVPEAAVPIVLEPAAAKRAPRTEYEGKFSLPYSTAALLVRGAVGVETYTEKAIGDPAVLEVARRVRYETRSYPTAGRAFPGGIRIRLRDGRTLEADCRYQKGAPENPLAPPEIRAKFRRNAGLALTPEAVAALEAAILGLDGTEDLAAALAPLRAAATGR
jgi:2-methylcitrate dehydratase PrpD